MKKLFSVNSIFVMLFALLNPAFSAPVLAQKRIPETVNLSVDVNAARSPISPYIYGLNFAKESFADEIDLPVRRWGGNTTSRYNWQNGNANTAMDWYFENHSVSNAYNWNLAETHDDWITQNETTNTDSLITIPMLGYVAKDDTSCGFNTDLYGAQESIDDPWRIKCGNGKHTNGSLITGNNPLDTSVVANPAFMQSWVANMVANHGASNSGGVKFYNLDNEPELWSDTHRDVHPAHQTYDELVNKSISYATAIKTADPNAKTLGYASFGWSGYWYSWSDVEAAAANGYTSFPDYDNHGNKYQVEWYLSQMKADDDISNHPRLLDYLDLHYYPASGVDLTTAGDAALQAKRLRSTRSLWDPTYIDESWIAAAGPGSGAVNLIPRMHGWVDANYPGTKLAITEYNFGGLEHINGALAQADVLGIFGREGLDLATLWNYPNPGSDPLGYDQFETLPGAYAFRIYRNYDGAGGKFGETNVSATSADQSKLSVYAAQRTADDALTLVIINKTANSISSAVDIANFSPAASAQVYRYSAANLNAILPLADQPVSGTGFNATFPPNSITLVVVPLNSGPQVTSVTRANANPTNAATVDFTVTFSEAVSGVDIADFTTTKNDAAVSSISPAGPAAEYTVSVTTGANDGTLRLDVPANAWLSEAFTSGEAYTIDKTAPQVIASDPFINGSANFTVKFSEPVEGVDASDFTFTLNGVTGTSIKSVSGSGSMRAVAVNPGSGSGTIRLDVLNNGSIKDEAGNSLSAAFTNGNALNKKSSVCYSAATKDGWTLESKELSGAGGTLNANGKLRAGDDALNRQVRSLLFFNTSSIPDNAVVSKVIVNIYKSNVTGADPFTTHGDLVADIKKGFFGLSPLELIDFNAAAEPINTAGKFRDIGGNWHQLSLNPLHFKYINLTGATQFRIRFVLDDNNDKTANIALFDSGSDANPPQLIIEYSVP